MSDPFIGQIDLFPYNFVPVGYLACDGKTYNVRDYQVLAALIGNTYGGNATQGTFAVPNLCGLAAVGNGTVAGGSATWSQGMRPQGTTSETLGNQQFLPPHTHAIGTLKGTTSTDATPATGMALSSAPASDFWCTPAAAGVNTTFAPSALDIAYSPTPAPHTNMQPYVVLQPCIAWQGEYPDFG
jgi:microcystin-dependent protein